jgi:hypothetical protein
MGLFPAIGNLPVIRGKETEFRNVWPLALSRDNALELAAWIVAVACLEKRGLIEFETILDAVRRSGK